MTLHSKPDPTMITNHFCACGLFSKWNIQQNYFVFVEFWTTFFRVSTCFNGSAAAMDAQLGFGTRLRWFCDRGVWWKRTFCGKFGSGNDVDWVLLLLDWVFRCQQWFEWRSQRFCCDVTDSNHCLIQGPIHPSFGRVNCKVGRVYPSNNWLWTGKTRPT